MFNWLTNIPDYMPHGMCLLWQPGLMALHIVSDALIALAYFAIPIAILIFVRRRSDLNGQHKLMAALFAVFITACGWTHVLSIVTLWQPIYGVEGLVKALTAVVSVGTALSLPFLLPQLLRIPSPRTLALEIEAHKATLAELTAARAQLAERVSSTEDDLRETTRRFEVALKASPITVFEQDGQFRYTWVYNPALGIDAAAFIDRTEFDIMAAESAQTLQALKARAMTSGQPQRKEVYIQRADSPQGGWFDLRVEPLILRNGEPGLVATSTDITDAKRQQEHLHLVMRELNHRAKNLLAIVTSIARQTARGFEVPAAFLERLQERLASLASAHDVLAERNWLGADLKETAEGQLRHQLQSYPDRIRIDGPKVDLPPETAHYIGMALHELGSNAVKYGALSTETGGVELAWTLTNEGRDLDLRWREHGVSGLTPPVRQGFGSQILTALAPGALKGTAELTYGEDGVEWRLQAPLS